MSDAAQYLLVVYQATQTESEPVSPRRVAAEVDRSPAATTKMLQRLESRGVVTYEPYTGVTLTDQGRETAAELQDTYFVLFRVFDDILALAAPETEAWELAGSLSPVVAERLARWFSASTGAKLSPTVSLLLPNPRAEPWYT